MRLVKSTETLEKNEKKLLYMCNARPVLKMRALFSDATKDYRNPPECDPGDSVALRLRTGKYNVNKAYMMIEELQNAINLKEKEIFLIKYKNLLEELENV